MKFKKIIAILLLICITSLYFPILNSTSLAVVEKLNTISSYELENSVQTEESNSGILIYEPTKLIEALANKDIKEITLGDNITIENVSNIQINGSNKTINGNNYKIIINGYSEIIANDVIKKMKDLTIETSNSINFTLNNGGSINNVNAKNINVIVNNADINLVSSSFKNINISSSNGSELYSCEINTINIEYSTVLISDSAINPSESEIGIYAGIWSNVTVRNTEINGGKIGVMSELNEYDMTLESVSIENCDMCGIYINGDEDGSYVFLKGVNIINCGNYGIYNTGSVSEGCINIEGKVVIENSMLGIYLKNGRLQIYNDGIIEDKKCIYSVYKDINSSIYDEHNILTEEKTGSGGVFYNCNTKESSDIDWEAVKVSNETEFIEALKDKNIYKIELSKDIGISTDNIIIEGIFKLIDGKGYKLKFDNSMLNANEFHITAESYLELLNINIESNSLVNIQMNLGGSFDTIISNKIRVNTYGTITVNNSKLYGISIGAGKNSKIVNSEVLTEGISIINTENITIENTKINYECEKNYTGILLDVNCSGTIKNVSIKNSDIGIMSNLNGNSVKLENVSIENCDAYGIYNNEGEYGSFLFLNGVNIVNCGNYGIYDIGLYESGRGDNGSINIEGKLIIENSMLGIYLKNGQLQIDNDGIIVDKKCVYSVYKDVNSIINDEANILIEEKTSSVGIFYNCNTKEASDINWEAVKVSTEIEFIEALKDKNIYKIELSKEIEISTNNINVEGIVKLVDGKGYKLIFNNQILNLNEFYIRAESYLELLNINIESNSIVNIQMNLGGSFDTIISNKVRVNTNGTITVNNSKLYGISILYGKNSKIVNSEILTEGISIDTTENILIENVKINYESATNHIGILLSPNCTGTIKNISIKNSSIGIMAELNGHEMTLENVSIENCDTYGIYNYGSEYGSILYLNGVNIANCKEYAIYCDGAEKEATIIVDKVNVLELQSQKNGIFLEYGDFILNGSLIHDGNGFAVKSTPQSTVSYNNNKLILLDNDGTDISQYVTKENYNDIIAPEIKLIGESVLELCIGEDYEEYGAIATDNIDTDINITICGSVNTNIEGTTILKYIALDSHGNESFIERKVIINNHYFNDWKVINEATCIEKGLKERTCDICKSKEYDNIEKIMHTWNEEYIVDKESTCTEKGQESIHCLVCNAIKENSEIEIELKEHFWDEGEITKEPTNTETGVKTYNCKNCNSTKTEIVDILKYSITGLIESSMTDNQDITIKVIEVGSNEQVYQKVFTGTVVEYSIENVLTGTYKLIVLKDNHVTREYFITVDDKDVIQDIQIYLIGDINGDAKVNIKDWNRMYNHINETCLLNNYELLCADVNKDKKVNIKDWNRLYNHINEVNPLW